MILLLSRERFFSRQSMGYSVFYLALFFDLTQRSLFVVGQWLE
ncbi:hypothetical protein [Desulfoluna limicola]|nr:hypothetical protein [Desulfoluna limicola]